MTVPDVDGAFDTVIWYPSHAPETPWQAGPFTINASPNAAVVEDQRFPIVLLSHGSGGIPWGHRDLAASLARSGFIVVAPAHLGDMAGRPRAKNQAQILAARPRQALAALNAALADERIAKHGDPSRIGMIGYSAGGYTALALAGARLDLTAASAYCRGEGRKDVGSCGPAIDNLAEAVGQLGTWQPLPDPRLKALVLMDPLVMVFDTASLAAIRIPVLLMRPEDDSYLNAKRNASALIGSLPKPPAQVTVPGRHFIFIDPCPDALSADAALICRDAPGVDRASIHRKIENAVADFLRSNL